MAINLANKYAKQLAQAFAQKSVVDGVACADYEFNGVKNIKVYTVVSQELNDYQRTGTNRYGEPQEAQDVVQDMTVSRDRSFSITVDKGNNSEQLDAKAASKILAIEMNEQAVPEMDKYALRKYADYAGKINAVSTAPAKTNIVELLTGAMTYLGNHSVPAEGRYIFIGWSNFGLIKQAPEFIGVEGLAKEILVKGALGMFSGAQIIVVPDSYLEKDGKKAYFVVLHKKSVLQPKKVQDYFVKENPAGINGALIEGRFIYDAFVIGAKCNGVYACVANGTQLAAPTLAKSGTNVTVTQTEATKIYYTTDGTDPRYSDSRDVVATGGVVSIAGGKTIKAVAFSDSKFTSDVAEQA